MEGKESYEFGDITRSLDAKARAETRTAAPSGPYGKYPYPESPIWLNQGIYILNHIMQSYII